MRSYKILAMGVVFALAAGAFAGAPDLQTWSNGSVVRVVVNDNQFNGSATIIGHKRDNNGDGWLCFLTADHVVSTTATAAGATYAKLGFAWGDGANANLNATPVANATGPVYRKVGAAVDLAVFGVKYGVFNAAYDPLVREVHSTGTSARDITSIGYGATGSYVPQKGYARANNSWQTQRYVNNNADGFGVFSPFGGYTFEGMTWDVDKPGAAGAVAGEGTIFDGDSGGAVFFSEPTNDTRFNPEPMVFSNKIVGVNSFNQVTFADPEYPQGLVAWNTLNGAVRITPEYKTWIDNSCMAVPEPASMSALALGLVALVARRRRK